MTKQQAISAMLKGEKVTHEYFTSDEFISMVSGSIVDENGYRFSPFDFWKYRTGEAFNCGWTIYNK